MLESLPLSEHDIDLIRPAIEESARVFFTRNHSKKIRKELKATYLPLRLIAGILAAIFALLLYFHHPMPNPFRLTWEGVIAIPVLLLAISITVSWINSRFRDSRFRIPVYVIESISAIALASHWKALGNWAELGGHSLETRISNHFTDTLLRTPITLPLHISLWISTVVLIIATAGVILEEITAHILQFGNPYGRNAYYSSVLIQGLLVVAYSLGQPQSDDLKVAHQKQHAIMRRLNLLARTAERPWAKYSRSSYGLAGPSLGNCGAEIALAIYEWLIELTFIGKPTEMTERVTTALQHAASGHWSLIKASGEYAMKAKTARAMIMARRLASAATAIAIALVSYVYFRQFIPHIYLQALVITCFGFATAQFFAFMDPNSSVGFDTATKIGQLFRGSDS